MNEPMISLCASAARPQFWYRLVQSTLGNVTPIEFVFVGPKPCNNILPDNFRYIQADVKPAQCYEIALRAAKGVLIGWTADDADYNHPSLKCPNSLDLIWNEYRKYDDERIILAQQTFEDGDNVSECHRFFFNDPATPRMAPFGFMNREWMLRLGGYDRNFICGQSENDLCMRAIEDGGTVELLRESKLYVHHGECHGDYPFRAGYHPDRAFLESCWVADTSKRLMSTKRLKEFSPFTDYQLTVTNQGPAGNWAKESV